jgi:hypothetical protein
MPACCHNPDNYRRTPDVHKRDGWATVHCAVCGRWLGHHDKRRDDEAGQKKLQAKGA